MDYLFEAYDDFDFAGLCMSCESVVCDCDNDTE